MVTNRINKPHQRISRKKKMKMREIIDIISLMYFDTFLCSTKFFIASKKLNFFLHWKYSVSLFQLLMIQKVPKCGL